jgi:hypothetical protein
MSDGVVGFQQVADTANDQNAMTFLINSLINKLATTALVKVLAVSNSGGVEPVGTVDVQPMVHQVDGAGNPTPHGTINNIPYFRLQGGANAVILDPQVGDIGVCVFCSRDISQVKRTKAPAAPATRRRYGWSDGLYIGGYLNGTPTQYTRFSDEGIEIKTPHNLIIDAPNATLDASGNLHVKGEVVANFGGASVTLTQHRHGTVGTPVAAQTIVPTPGT